MLPSKLSFKPTVVRIEKTSTVRKAKEIIGEALGKDPAQLRLWSLCCRRNGTVRIDRPWCSAKRQMCTLDAMFSEQLHDAALLFGTNNVLLVEYAPDTDRWDDAQLLATPQPANNFDDLVEVDDENGLPMNENEQARAALVREIESAPIDAKWIGPAARDYVQLLIKRYDMDENGNGSIELVDFVTVNRWCSVRSMMPLLRRMGRFAADQQLYVFEEEVWSKKVPSIVSEKRDRSDSTLQQLKLFTGDIVIIQATPLNAPLEKTDQANTLAMQVLRSYPYTAQQYFQMMRRRVDLILSPFAYAEGVRTDPLPPLQLMADKNWPLSVVLERVARIYNNATARWLADAERALNDAKQKHAASDGTDPHLNALLREATGAYNEEQLRAAAPLCASHLRLYEQTHANLPPVALYTKLNDVGGSVRKLYYMRLGI